MRCSHPSDGGTPKPLPEVEKTLRTEGVRAELFAALSLDSLMLLCSAEHFLDHLDRR